MANGVRIQQTLGGVCMATIASIDDMHMGGNMLSNQIRGARLAVAHHKNISSHRTQVGNGVEQGLALAG